MQYHHLCNWLDADRLRKSIAAVATEDNNSCRRSRLSASNADRPRYRHLVRIQCSCKKRSINARGLETVFLRLVGLLTIRDEALPEMLEMTLQSERSKVEEGDLETQKQAAIAKHKRRIDAARSDLSREEYLKHK